MADLPCSGSCPPTRESSYIIVRAQLTLVIGGILFPHQGLCPGSTESEVLDREADAQFDSLPKQRDEGQENLFQDPLPRGEAVLASDHRDVCSLVPCVPRFVFDRR